MTCINLIFKYGETIDKNELIKYIKNTVGGIPIVEKLKGSDKFYSIKFIDKSTDTIVRIIDLTECDLNDKYINKILMKLNDTKEIDNKTILYCFFCSAKEASTKISSLIEKIKNEVKDEYVLFIKDKNEVNPIKIDSIILKFRDSLNDNSLIFLDDLDDNDVIRIARKISGINFLIKKWDFYKYELVKEFDDYLIKTMYMNINKIKLKNRSEMFKKEDGDITNADALTFKKKYMDLLEDEMKIREDKLNDFLCKYKAKFNLEYLNFEILDYKENIEFENDGSKISNLYRDMIERKNENNEKKLANLFKIKVREEDTNTEYIEKFIIEESYRNKVNLQKSMDDFKRQYLSKIK